MDFKTNSMDVKMVSVGHLNMTLASFIVVVGGFLLATVIIALSPSSVGIFSALFILLGSVLSAYNINCAQLGHCQTWAWVLTTLYILGVILSMFSVFRFKTVDKIVGKVKSFKK